jgi:hypothetical protein
VIAVRDHLGDLGDALVVVVTFTDDVTRLDAYREHLGVPFPLLADADRRLYGLLGVGRGSVRQVWSPGTLRMYAGLVRRGRRLRRPTEDTRQLGADAVIDRDGRLHRLWRPSSPDDRPSIHALVDAVRSVG